MGAAEKLEKILGKQVKAYIAQKGAKNRIVIRDDSADAFAVTHYPNGDILLSPRVLAHPDDIIGRETLEMIDRSVSNANQNQVGDTHDFAEADALIAAIDSEEDGES